MKDVNLNHVGETVRLGLLGLGERGYSQLNILLGMPDVEITAICDADAGRIERAAKAITDKRSKKPFCTTKADECIQHKDVDATVIMTGWDSHVPLTIMSLRAGKRAAMEVAGSTSLDESWQLVHASEETGIPVMLLENCCYGETELTLQNMIRSNLFGILVHCAGAYSHDLRELIGKGSPESNYRQANYICRNGDLYPTHELGPIANYLNINRGNRMVTLTSMASKACGMHTWLAENRPNTPSANMRFNQGDVVNTMIRCANGETILITHDCTLPRPYSRGGIIRGTKGMWMEDGRSIFLDEIAKGSQADWKHQFESDKVYFEKYRHPLWHRYREFGIRGNHDGMDYLVLRAFIESVQNQTEPPIDVYDAATWMSITCLSEQSIANGSLPVSIPDFTNGKWCLNRNNPARSEFDC